MNIDLVSAYSARVCWSTETNVSKIECFGQNFYDCVSPGASEKCTTIINLSPDSTYNVRLSVVGSDGEITQTQQTLSTHPEYEPLLENLYEGLRAENGTYDTTRLNTEVHDVFVKNFSSVVRSGDSIVAKVSINGVSKDIMTSAVTNGSSIEVTNSANIFLPFSKENASMQTATLKSKVGEATLAYDATEDSFGYGGEMHKVGDRFEMLGHMVTVGYGSIVLVFSDTVEKTWGFQPAHAASVSAGTAGSHFTSNLTANVMNLVATKATGETTSTYNSTWAHNTTDSTTVEMTRMVHTIDEDSENATLSLGVRHLDISGNTYIEPIIQGSYDATTISAQDTADATASATFTHSGLQFDTEAAAVYFGGSQEFRIQFTSGTPSLLQIQSYDSGAGAYVTRQEFSDAS